MRRNRFVEIFAKAFKPITWCELQDLFLWYDSPYMMVMVMKCLGEFSMVVAVAISPYINDIFQEFPVRTNSNL